MVEEIIYTSSDRGLKQGSRGFCTVVSTAGMALNLAERLESMSGYRHVFPLNDPDAARNPVNYSHVTFRLAGRKLNVVSRVADAGQDYTGRSNKLAHHVVIDSIAPLPAGPARLLMAEGTVVNKWDGTVRNIPPRALIPPKYSNVVLLKAWATQTGDAGWAGAVAEMLVQDPAPVSIIFRPGMDTLSLVCEVLDVLPPSQRWGITFSTYFTRLLAGTECQLRFLLDGTPEATALRNDARARKVDLTQSLPAATGGALVQLARSGKVTHSIPTTVGPKQKISPAASEQRRSKVAPLTEDDLLALESEVADYSDTTNTGGPSTPARGTPPSRDVPPIRTQQSAADDQMAERRQLHTGRGRWILSGTIAVVMLAAMGGIGFFVWSEKSRQPQVDNKA